MEIKTEKVTLKVEDGSSMDAFVARPNDDNSYPGIILYQEAFGVSNHIRNVVRRIAKEGYIVIAPELFHRTAEPGFECSPTDFSVAAPHFQALTADGLIADAKASFQWLSTNPKLKDNKIGNIGFCLGGRVSFLTNTALPVSASVSFYGGGLVPFLDRVNNLHAPQLFFWGGLDKHITHEQVEQVVQAMRVSGKPFANIEISYADHAFFNDERPNYNEKAANEAWGMVVAFFKNNL